RHRPDVMCLADVKPGIRQHEIKRGGGHASGHVLKMPTANEDEADDDRNMPHDGERSLQPKSGVELLTKLTNGSAFRPDGWGRALRACCNWTMDVQLIRGWTERHGAQAHEHGATQPEEAAEIQIGRQRRPLD